MNSTGINDWIQNNIVPLILCVIGVIILAGARKFRLSDVTNIAIIAVIGLIFIVGPAAFLLFGEEMSNLLFNNGGGGGGGGPR